MQMNLFNDILTWHDKWQEAKDKIWNIYQKHNGKLALAFSGGKDSTVLLEMVRQVEREREIKILVVASDTGVELKTIRERMYANADVVLQPKDTFGSNAVKLGKPFKNKNMDFQLKTAQRNTILIAENDFTFERTRSGKKVLETVKKGGYYSVDKKGKVMPGNTLSLNGLSGSIFSIKRYADALYNKTLPKISNDCCNTLKKIPFKKFTKENDIECWMTGERLNEGGSRADKMRQNGCYYNSNGAKKLVALKDFTDQDMQDAIKHFNIDIDVAYKYFDRTGCWMCPYGKFRKGKFVFENAYKQYDAENGTNYHKAFLAINKERIEFEKEVSNADI